MELPDPTEIMKPLATEMALYKKQPHESLKTSEILKYKDHINHVIIWLFGIMAEQYHFRHAFCMTDTIKARLVQHILINDKDSFMALDRQFDEEMQYAQIYGSNEDYYE